MSSYIAMNSHHDSASFGSVRALYGKGQLPLLHLNARRLRNKVQSMTVFLESLGHLFDILSCTENWFSDDSQDVHFTVYKYASVSRKCTRVGGVAFHVKNHLDFKIIYEYSLVNADYECLMIKCVETMLSVLYRPPSGIASYYFSLPEIFLQFCLHLALPVIVSGDFNIDLLSSDPNKRKLLDICLSFGNGNVIHVPTRVRNISETLLALCFTNQ